MTERLKTEIVSERFFRGVCGEVLPAEIEVSPNAADYYRKTSGEWADDYAGLTETEHRQVAIIVGQKNGRKGHFIKCQIVYLPKPRI